jgi:hypothetical protein
VPVFSRQEQPSSVDRVHSVHIGPSGDQSIGHAPVTNGIRGEIQFLDVFERRRSVEGVKVGARGLLMANIRAQHQRSAAIFVLGLEIGLGGDKQIGHAPVVNGKGGEYRSWRFSGGIGARQA